MREALAEGRVAVTAADLGGMRQARPGAAVAGEGRSGDADGGDVLDHRARQRRQVREPPEEAHGSELHGVAQPGPVAAVAVDVGPLVGTEVEEAP